MHLDSRFEAWKRVYHRMMKGITRGAALLRTSSSKYNSSVLVCLPPVETQDTYFDAGRLERLIHQV